MRQTIRLKVNLIAATLAAFVQRNIKVPDIKGDVHQVDPITKVPLYKDAKEKLKPEDILDAVYYEESNSVVVVTTDGKKIAHTLNDKQLGELKKASPESFASETADKDA